MDEATRHRLVQEIAFEIYEREGRPIGRAVKHWQAAERELYERMVREHEVTLQDSQAVSAPKPKKESSKPAAFHPAVG